MSRICTSDVARTAGLAFWSTVVSGCLCPSQQSQLPRGVARAGGLWIHDIPSGVRDRVHNVLWYSRRSSASSRMGFCATASTKLPVLQGGEDFSSGLGGDPGVWVLILAPVKGQADTQWVHIIYRTISKTLIPSPSPPKHKSMFLKQDLVGEKMYYHFSFWKTLVWSFISKTMVTDFGFIPYASFYLISNLLITLIKCWVV